MKEVRVLFFATACDRGGGSFCSLLILATELRNRGLAVPFIVLPNHGSGENDLRAANIEYLVAPSFGSEWPLDCPKTIHSRLSHFRQRLSNAKAIRQTSRWAKNRRINLVHINTSVNETGFYVAKRLRVPFVWHIREFLKEGLGIEFYNEKRVRSHMAQANAVITISNALLERCRSDMPRVPVYLVHNGIDYSRFFFARVASDVHPTVCIASMGRVSRLKGHYDLLDAFERVLKRFPDSITLLFIGSGGDELKRLTAERSLSDRVHFCGFLDRPELALRSVDVYVAGHPWEGLGRATAEAMAAGCCVVGVDNAGTKDLVLDGKTGLLYPVGDIEKLTDQLCFLIKNPLRRIELARQGQKYISEKFSVSQYVDGTFEVYEKIMCTGK